jgi:hypothetical protein
MSKFIWGTYIAAVDCFYKKFSWKEIRWHKVWGWWWSKSTPYNVITGEVLQVTCGFHNIAGCHIMLIAAVLFVLFHQSI